MIRCESQVLLIPFIAVASRQATGTQMDIGNISMPDEIVPYLPLQLTRQLTLDGEA